MTRRPPKAVSTSTIPGGSVLTSPISAARSPPGTARSAASAASADVGRDEGDQLALVGHVHRVDARAAPRRRPPSGSDGHVALAHDHRHARGARELVEHGGHARRGSRRAGSAVRDPAASSSASTAGHSDRVSDSISASRPSSPRASMIAVPCSPIEPDSRMRSPGRSASGDRRARGSRRPTPGRADVHAVGVAALDDLRVARDDLHLARSRRRPRSPRPRRAGRRRRGPPRGSARRSAPAAARPRPRGR